MPGLVQLYIHLSAEATEPNHPANAYFRERFRAFRAAAAEASAASRQAARSPTTSTPEVAASLLLAVADGLQTQWLMDPSIDMGEHIDGFLDLLGISTPPPNGT